MVVTLLLLGQPETNAKIVQPCNCNNNFFNLPNFGFQWAQENPLFVYYQAKSHLNPDAKLACIKVKLVHSSENVLAAASPQQIGTRCSVEV